MAIISIINVRGVRRSCSILRHPVHLGRFCVRTCRSSFFYVPARFGADFLAAIEINRDLPLARTSPPSRRAGTQSPSPRDLLAALAHPPAACGGAGQISNKKAPSSKLVVLFCCLFAVRGGFENENQCATESIE